MNVSQGTISRYESGMIRVIPYDKLKQVSEVLGCRIYEIIEDDPLYAHYRDEEHILETRASEEEALIEWYHSLPIDQRAFLKDIIMNKKSTSAMVIFKLPDQNSDP